MALPAPVMPVTYSGSGGHREHIPLTEYPFPDCVARPVRKKELYSTPKAIEAMEKEWERLRDLGTWDESAVEEWRDAAREPHV